MLKSSVFEKKSIMDFETQTQNKKYRAGAFGDIYTGIVMLPKEIEIEKEVSPPLELRFQLPDFRAAVQVSLFFILFFLLLGLF